MEIFIKQNKIRTVMIIKDPSLGLIKSLQYANSVRFIGNCFFMVTEKTGSIKRKLDFQNNELVLITPSFGKKDFLAKVNMKFIERGGKRILVPEKRSESTKLRGLSKESGSDQERLINYILRGK